MTLNSQFPVSRRTLMAGAISAAACSLAGRLGVAAEREDESPYRICAFIKFVQSLSFRELAERIAELGFDGIEATVRPKGLIEPERASDELPELVEELHRCGLAIDVMTTNVVEALDVVSRNLLKTASELRVLRYRMGYFRYDMKRPLMPQLEPLQAQINELADVNRELGLTAVYQNHAGSGYVGSTIWDLQQLLQSVPSSDIGIAFDIRHATAEAGMSWPVLFRVAEPHLQAIYVKDFVWEGRRPRNVPLGEGQVNPEFFRQLRKSPFSGPISLHVEYLPKASVEENLTALGDDLAELKSMLDRASDE